MMQYLRTIVISNVRWTVIFSIIAFIFMGSQALILRIINSLFLGGLIIFCKGGLSFASYLGGFDLFSYSHKKLRNYAKKKLEENDEIDHDRDPGSYYDYINNRKKNRDFLVPLSIGGIFMIISAVLIIFC